MRLDRARNVDRLAIADSQIDAAVVHARNSAKQCLRVREAADRPRGRRDAAPRLPSGVTLQDRQEAAPQRARVGAVRVQEGERRVLDAAVGERTQQHAAAQRRTLEHIQKAEGLGAAPRARERGQGPGSGKSLEEAGAAAACEGQTFDVPEMGEEGGVCGDIERRIAAYQIGATSRVRQLAERVQAVLQARMRVARGPAHAVEHGGGGSRRFDIGHARFLFRWIFTNRNTSLST